LTTCKCYLRRISWCNVKENRDWWDTKNVQKYIAYRYTDLRDCISTISPDVRSSDCMYDYRRIYLDIMGGGRGERRRKVGKKKKNARTSSGTALENFMIASWFRYLRLLENFKSNIRKLGCTLKRPIRLACIQYVLELFILLDVRDLCKESSNSITSRFLHRSLDVSWINELRRGLLWY